MCCLISHFQLKCSFDVIERTTHKEGGDVIYGRLMRVCIYVTLGWGDS